MLFEVFRAPVVRPTLPLKASTPPVVIVSWSSPALALYLPKAGTLPLPIPPPLASRMLLADWLVVIRASEESEKLVMPELLRVAAISLVSRGRRNPVTESRVAKAVPSPVTELSAMISGRTDLVSVLLAPVPWPAGAAIVGTIKFPVPGPVTPTPLRSPRKSKLPPVWSPDRAVAVMVMVCPLASRVITPPPLPTVRVPTVSVVTLEAFPNNVKDPPLTFSTLANPVADVRRLLRFAPELSRIKLPEVSTVCLGRAAVPAAPL